MLPRTNATSAIAEPIEDGVLAPNTVAQGHPQRQWMVFGEGSLCAVAGDDGSAEAFGELDYVIRTAGGVDFLAEEDDGAFGVAEQVPSAFDLDRITLRDVGFAGSQDFDIGLLAQEVGGTSSSMGRGRRSRKRTNASTKWSGMDSI